MVRRQTMGERLREEREAQGLSLKDLARKIKEGHRVEIGSTTIRQVEQGIVPNPGIKTVEAIARGLHLPPLEVIAMGLDDPPPQSSQRFSASKLATVAEIYEALPANRKIWWDELLDMIIERMRKG